MKINVGDIEIPNKSTVAISDYPLCTLLESIYTYGLMSPIIVRKDPEIVNLFTLIDGKARLTCCKMLGQIEIEVIVCE